MMTMKKILQHITATLLLGSVAFSSCTKGFTEKNTNPNAVPEALPQQLLQPSVVNTMTYNMIRNRNFNNELMQVTVDMGDAEGRVFRYDFRSNLSDYFYNGLYSQLTDIKDIYKVANTAPNSNSSYRAISLILQSWIYANLTDTFGDIPYFESNQGKDSLNFEPKFDEQKTIYLDIFSKLEQANELLKLDTAIIGASDPIYGGNISRWRKFGNSLYLRLLLRISHKPDVANDCIAKIREILETNSANYPVIANNDESATVRWIGGGALNSPYLTVREQDFRQPAIASFFIDNLVNWRDPRIDPVLGTSGVNRWRIAAFQGSFQGVPSGYHPNENPEKKSYFYSTNQTVSGNPAPTLMNDPMTGIIMNYAEVQFIRAEAALRGWTTASPGTHYNLGAEAAIKYWIPAWTVAIQSFLEAADIQWNDAESFEEKLAKIHLQKYYALFLVDYQQWFEYRRTGYPVLPKGGGLQNGGIMPARMNYPVYVQSTNPTNYQIAVERQGADNMSTQVWWQRP